jgi:hypothetical protein
MTFASASSTRNTPKTTDPQTRANLSHAGDANRTDQHGLKDRSTKEKERVEGEDYKTREPRAGLNFGRRNGKEDGDSWSGLRSTKNLSTDEGDRQIRRTGDRDFRQDKVENGDNRRQQRGFETHRRDATREAEDSRRNGTGQKARSSWYRDEDGQELEPQENRDINRTRDWRDGDRANRRGPERDWDRNRRVEQDPEWLLEPDGDEKKQTHTAEDIEAWKASMKAGKANPEPVVPLGEAKPETEPVAAPKLDTPLGIDPKFDSFFGLWSDPKIGENGAPTDKGVDNIKSAAGGLVTSKSSRFTGFFSPKPEIQQQVAAPPAPAPAPTSGGDMASNEDKVGFQRIMQMLGSKPNPNAALQPSDMQNHKDQPSGNPLLKAFQEQIPQPPQKVRTPPRDQTPTNPPASPPILSPRSRRSITLDNLLGGGPQSPEKQTHNPNSESEYLLRLIQPKMSEQRQMAQNAQRLPTGNAPGILPHPNLMNQMNHIPQPNQFEAMNQSFYDDIRQENPESQDKLNPTARRAHRTSVSNLLDDFADPHRQPQMGMPGPYGLPPGLQRPPGFDQPPQGYPQHMQQQMQQQQRHNMVGPPPGFQVPGRNPNSLPPGLIPNLSNLNIGVDRGVPPYMRHMGPGPGPGSGALPPQQRFMMGGPPPGFPPMQDDGRLFLGGIPPRGPMDMFEGGFGGSNGGGIGRGGFGGQFAPTGFKRPE